MYNQGRTRAGPGQDLSLISGQLATGLPVPTYNNKPCAEVDPAVDGYD
jgi:hypothetical protein